jgi:hypothetical protein
VGIIYRSREDAAPEAELNALSAIYRFILERSENEAAEPAPKPDGRNDGAIVRDTEGVSHHVEQRPDRSSEITWPAAL